MTLLPPLSCAVPSSLEHIYISPKRRRQVGLVTFRSGTLKKNLPLAYSPDACILYTDTWYHKTAPPRRYYCWDVVRIFGSGFSSTKKSGQTAFLILDLLILHLLWIPHLRPDSQLPTISRTRRAFSIFRGNYVGQRMDIHA